MLPVLERRVCTRLLARVCSMLVAALTLSGCVVGESSGDGWICVPQLVQSCACHDGTTGSRVCNGGRAWSDCNLTCNCANGSIGVSPCDTSATLCYCAGSVQVCTSGQTQSCTCANGNSGSQECVAGGTGWGTCACGASTCTASFGQSCSSDAQCCAYNGAATFCANFGTGGYMCSVRCAMDSSCSTGCCATLADMTLGCGPATECSATSSCSRSLGASCSTDADCCAEAGNGQSVVCVGYGTAAPLCWATCTTNADCTSACCIAGSNGTHACAPASMCGISTATCSVADGSPCVTDTDCCANATTGVHTVCSNFGTGPLCWELCTDGTTCSTGCCAARSDGTKSCAPAGSCP